MNAMIAAMTIFLGCYTDDPHPCGLKTLALDVATGAMSITGEHRVSNALYQALSPDGRFLWSCTGEGLESFRIEGGKLVPVDTVGLGDCVCHVAAMPAGDRVVFADYLGGFGGSAKVSDGTFGETVRHAHTGCGPNLPRQKTAHCHQACPLPDGSGYVLVDLGLDELVTYPSGRVYKTAPLGAGPRHLLFHPNGRLAFLVSELGNLITTLSWNAADGFHSLCTLPTRATPDKADLERSDSTNLAAAIRLSPDGRRVIVSNRGENSLVAYDFDEATGSLSFKARTLLPGSWPRDFIFVDDTTALVAMERSGEVHAVRYDATTGEFKVLSTLGGLFRPVALLAVAR